MKLTPALIARIQRVRPGEDSARVILDPRGIHHSVPGSRDLAQSVAHHAVQKEVSAAESLFVVERLGRLGAAHPRSSVRGQGAIVQSFHGAGEMRGCHTIPCQLVLDNQFPHQLRDGDGKAFNSAFLHRAVLLFARCTWQPKVVNAIDQVLEWNQSSDFVARYLQSVKAVLEGQPAEDAYQEYRWGRHELLRGLRERMQDEPLSPHDVMLLMGGTTGDSGLIEGLTERDVERLLTDQYFWKDLEHQREVVIETYAEQSGTTPHVVLSGELREEVTKEDWASGGTEKEAAAAGGS